MQDGYQMLNLNSMDYEYSVKFWGSSKALVLECKRLERAGGTSSQTNTYLSQYNITAQERFLQMALEIVTFLPDWVSKDT